MTTSTPRVVVMGGGTGTFTVLSALKHDNVHLSAIVNMVDDGGSTGVLRDQFGTLPPGDVRQCLVALCSDSQLMRDLLNYRYSGGSLEGHAFGNLLLTALEKLTGSFADAVKAAGSLFKIEGDVIPVTINDVRLCLKKPDGQVVTGEKLVTQSFFQGRGKPQLFLRPEAVINPDAAAAIAAADMIVIGPGNLYSSLIPTLLVEGVTVALWASPGKKVFLSNLVTKPGQTTGFRAHDFLQEVEHYAGQGLFDYLVYNNVKPERQLLERYNQHDEQWVEFDEAAFVDRPYQAIGADLVSHLPTEQDAHDTLLERNLIRHDGEKLSRALLNVLKK